MALAEIYTTAVCSYCVAAKNFLKQRGCDYREIRVDREPGKLEEMLIERTVVMVFSVFAIDLSPPFVEAAREDCVTTEPHARAARRLFRQIK